MSIASQQRVIEDHQATIRSLRQQLAQAKADQRAALDIYQRLTALCDEHVTAGMTVVPITVLRQIRPKGTGIGGGRA